MQSVRKYCLALWLGCVAAALPAESVQRVDASVERILPAGRIVLRADDPRRLPGRHGDIHYDIIANGQRRRIVPARVIVLEVIGANEVLAEIFDARGAVRPGYRATFLLPVTGGQAPPPDVSSPPADNPSPAETAVAARAPAPGGDSPPSPAHQAADDVMRHLGRMAYIPGGPAMIGVDDGNAKFWNESPPHQVFVAPFYMDRHEVTCADYARFLQATGHPPPPDWTDNRCPAGRENLPITYVSWADASAFARWCGKRLPTEAEWEFAGRGQRQWLYPWGNAFHPGATISQEAGTGGPRPVGAWPEDQSYYGVYDLAGNVSEWTASLYRPYPGNRHPEKEYALDRRVARGGAFSVTSVYCRLVFRAHLPPHYTAGDLGFRCVVGESELNSQPARPDRKETARD